MRFPVLILLVEALLAAACGGDTPTSPSTTSSSSATVTERFDSIIDVKGSSFFPFAVNQSGGSVSINFASLSPLNRPGLLPVTMQIGYGMGVKDDDGNVVGCDLLKTIQAAPSLTAQLTDPLTVGTNYCAKIDDIGALTESANFSIRITHP
jgi:hypothetical protein